MIKEAYFRGLMKVAQAAKKQLSQQEKDKALIDGHYSIPRTRLQDHNFYKGTLGSMSQESPQMHSPDFYRATQADHSANKFAPSRQDHVRRKLLEYYMNIGRQNRDFYLKQGFRPPKDHKYRTPFPFPNHPKKNQMMLQNQYQVNNNKGAQGYGRYA